VWDHFIWDHDHLIPRSFETCSFETCSFETTLIWDVIHLRLFQLRPHSFYATFKWSCFDLLCIRFLWCTFHFLWETWSFARWLFIWRFARLRPSVIKDDSGRVVNVCTCALKHRGGQKALHTSSLEGSVALENHLGNVDWAMTHKAVVITGNCVTGEYLASKFRGGRFQWYLALKSHYEFTTLRKMLSIPHNTAVTKQFTVQWPYISKGVFGIAQNHGKKGNFRRF